LKSEDRTVDDFTIIFRTNHTPQYEPVDPQHNDRRC